MIITSLDHFKKNLILLNIARQTFRIFVFVYSFYRVKIFTVLLRINKDSLIKSKAYWISKDTKTASIKLIRIWEEKIILKNCYFNNVLLS